MAYDYIKKRYGLDFAVGMGVQHTVTKKFGKVAREAASQGHYVQVKFEGSKYAAPCHPEELTPVALDAAAYDVA
jgi:hypothetical protein